MLTGSCIASSHVFTSERDLRRIIEPQRGQTASPNADLAAPRRICGFPTHTGFNLDETPEDVADLVATCRARFYQHANESGFNRTYVGKFKLVAEAVWKVAPGITLITTSTGAALKENDPEAAVRTKLALHLERAAFAHQRGQRIVRQPFLPGRSGGGGDCHLGPLAANGSRTLSGGQGIERALATENLTNTAIQRGCLDARGYRDQDDPTLPTQPTFRKELGEPGFANVPAEPSNG